MTREIILARYHDGGAKPNWGGRATSLAFGRLASTHPGVDRVYHLDGRYNTRPFESTGTLGRTPANGPDPEPLWFSGVDEVADRIVRKPQGEAQLDLVAKLNGVSEMWMNGEGDFILRRGRQTLARTLLLMTVAAKLGVKVHLVNSILSLPPDGQSPPKAMVDAVQSGLELCSSVSYRDPVSLEMHQEYFPQISAEWAPDALTVWARLAPVVPMLDRDAYGPGAELLGSGAQEFFRSSEPYVAISGSSFPGDITAQNRQVAADVVSRLRKADLRVALVATDTRDKWLEELVTSSGTAFIEARVPLDVGAGVLSSARAFLSGRYHPSILAATQGTPSVWMQSNSHKTLSVQHVLGFPEPREFEFFTGDVEEIAQATITAASSTKRDRARIRRNAATAADQLIKRAHSL